MWVYLRDGIDENRFHNCVGESDRESPFRFQCQQQELLRIASVETELNNTVNKSHV